MGRRGTTWWQWRLTLASFDGMQERRTRVLGEVIHAEDPPPPTP